MKISKRDVSKAVLALENAVETLYTKADALNLVAWRRSPPVQAFPVDERTPDVVVSIYAAAADVNNLTARLRTAKKCRK